MVRLVIWDAIVPIMTSPQCETYIYSICTDQMEAGIQYSGLAHSTYLETV